MPKRSLSDLVLESIDTISARKNRPNLVRIYRHLHKWFDLSFQTCEALLQSLLKEGKVIPVTYKGNISYRNASKWKKYSYYMKKTMESELPGTLLTHAISELVVQEPDYLNNGVPWDVLKHHLLSTKNKGENVNEEALQKLLQRELKLESMLRLENGNYFLGPNPVKPRCYENKTIKFEAVRKSIPSDTINYLSADKVSNLYSCNNLYCTNETSCDKEPNELLNSRSRDVNSLKSGEPSPNSSSEIIDFSECQEVVISEDSCNGYNSLKGMMQKLSDYKLTEEVGESEEEMEIITANEVEIPNSNQEHILLQSPENFEDDIEFEEEDVHSDEAEGAETHSSDNNNVIEIECNTNFEVVYEGNPNENLRSGYECISKGTNAVSDESNSLGFIKCGNDPDLKDNNSVCVDLGKNENIEVSVKSASKKCIEVDGEYTKKILVVDECDSKRNIVDDESNSMENNIAINECNFKGNSIAADDEFNPVRNNIVNDEFNSKNKIIVDDDFNSMETMKIDECNSIEQIKVTDESNLNEVVIDDVSSSSSKVDTINSSETQEKFSDNDEEEALEDDGETKQENMKEVSLILGRVRRQKKKKYDASDYYFPSLKRKSRDSTIEQEKNEAKRKKKKKKKKESPVVNNGNGLFTKQVMFPGNTNMCSECKCYESKIKQDPMIVCTSCTNEGHQSCAIKCMKGDSWFCVDCRQDVEHCKICKKTPYEENLGILYACCNCGYKYHKGCHSPSIQDSSSKWHCFRCPPIHEDDSISSEDCSQKSQNIIETTPLAESKNKMFSYFSDEPPDPTNWTPSEVYSYFRKYFEEDIARTILEQGIDGYSLKLLDRGDILKLDFKLGTCLKLLLHIKRLQLQSNNLIEIWKS